MFYDFRDTLVLGAHVDDIELGCGGLLTSAIHNNGAEVSYYAFSDCEKSLPEGVSITDIREETRCSLECLGVEAANACSFYIDAFPVRNFTDHRQEILDILLRLDVAKDAEVIFVPCSYDTHQDHQVIYQEACRAFRDKTILGYEHPWNCYESKLHLFVGLTEEEMQRKVEALACYESQKHRSYMQPDFIRSWAKMRSVQGHCSCPYTEAFEVIRWQM